MLPSAAGCCRLPKAQGNQGGRALRQSGRRNCPCLASPVPYEAVWFRSGAAVSERGGRGDVRYDAILLAALRLLAEVGYDQMTMDAIAERARASKATIYRRWSGKADLVVAALKRYATPPPTPP